MRARLFFFLAVVLFPAGVLFCPGRGRPILKRNAAAIPVDRPGRYGFYRSPEHWDRLSGMPGSCCLANRRMARGLLFRPRPRVIKYLHEKLGFDVLAFESGLYDCARIWENVEAGGTVSEEVVGSLFYMYATSVQMQDLFGYIQGQLHAARIPCRWRVSRVRRIRASKRRYYSCLGTSSIFCGSNILPRSMRK